VEGSSGPQQVVNKLYELTVMDCISVAESSLFTGSVLKLLM